MENVSPPNGPTKYRILTLDGGGAWALLQAMALGQIYGQDTPGHDILQHFDLVAANSGGSIVLGALIEGHSPSAILNNFFLNAQARNSVFVSTGLLGKLCGYAGIGPKYSTISKLAGLQNKLVGFGDIRLGSLKSSLVERGNTKPPDFIICTFDYDRSRGILFRSNRTSRAASFTQEVDPTLAEAIHASTNAPINYFDRPASLYDPLKQETRQFWDGGIAGYNNPVLVAVMEALANNHAREDIIALSLGTGTTFLPFDPHHQFGVLGQAPRFTPRRTEPNAFKDDLSQLATAIVDDPPDIASYFAHIALGGGLPATVPNIAVSDGPVVRMNPMIQPVLDQGGNWCCPQGVSDFDALAQLPMDAIEDPQVQRIVEFGNAWLADNVTNQPIRCNRDTLACEIGQSTFSAALAAWQKACGCLQNDMLSS
jgi:hypothetical protein